MKLEIKVLIVCVLICLGIGIFCVVKEQKRKEEFNRFKEVTLYKIQAGKYVPVGMSDIDRETILDALNGIEGLDEEAEVSDDMDYKFVTNDGTFFYDGDDTIIYDGNMSYRVKDIELVKLFKRVTTSNESNQTSNSNMTSNSNITSNSNTVSNSNEPVKSNSNNSNIKTSNSNPSTSISNTSSNSNSNTRKPSSSDECCSCCPDLKPGESCIALCCSCS